MTRATSSGVTGKRSIHILVYYCESLKNLLVLFLEHFRDNHSRLTVRFLGNEASWIGKIDNHYAEFAVSSAGTQMDTFTLALPSIDVNGEY